MMEEQTFCGKDLHTVILAYLANHNTCSLATEGANGRPHAAAVFYVNRGFNLYFLSSPSSRHGQNMAHHPHVSATINEDYAQWRSIKGIQLEGVVSSVGGIVENGKITLDFIRKFPDVAHFFSSPQKLGEAILKKVEGVGFYKLTPSRIFFINNEEGFGHRDEVIIESGHEQEISNS